jgi:hypothetical protein
MIFLGTSASIEDHSSNINLINQSRKSIDDTMKVQTSFRDISDAENINRSTK